MLLLIKSLNESITSDVLLLFKRKILQAIGCTRRSRKHPDTNTIYERLSKTEASNIDKSTAQKLKFPIADFFSKCDQIRSLQ